MNTPTQIPLGGEPPTVEITEPRIIGLIERMGGMTDSLDAIKKMKSDLSGVKLAICAIESEFHQARCVLLANLNQLAAKSGVDGAKWLVSGTVSNKGKISINFASADEVDK
jgi:hypothetical protein